MRIYSNAYELMSETGRNLYEMGILVKPRYYQNKYIGDKPEFETKELEAEQYTLLSLPDPEMLFIFTHSKDWADTEFSERVSGKKINPGEAWKLRENVWREFLDSHGEFDYTYAERMNTRFYYKNKVGTSINNIISLLKDDPDTRKAIISIYNATDSNCLDGKYRIPCSMYYDFMIRKVPGKNDYQLNIHYHQRSSDFVTHFGNDVYLAWRLMEYIAEKVNVKPGYLVHSIDSLHVYHKDWELLKDSVSMNR